MINKKSFLALTLTCLWISTSIAGELPSVTKHKQEISITYPKALLNASFYNSPHNIMVKVSGAISGKKFKGEIPIVGIKATSGSAFTEVERALTHMLKHVSDDIKFGIIASHIKIAIIADAHHQKLTQLPEYSDLDKSWDDNEGVGATFHTKTQSIGEINITCRDATPVREESVFVHEFAHVIYDIGLGYYTPKNYSHDDTIKPPKKYGIDRQTQEKMQKLDTQVEKTYRSALHKKIYKPGVYMIHDATEYFAEGSQAYFNAQSRDDVNTLEDNYKMSLIASGNIISQFLHHTRGINTYSRLETYDPDLFSLLQHVYGKPKPWDFCHDMPSNIPHCRFYCVRDAV